MTTLRLSQSETSAALIAELPARADLNAGPVNDRPLQVVEPIAARPAALEYRVVYVTKSISGLPNEGVEDDLNKGAREGWRLAGCLTNDEGRTTGLILERASTASCGD